VLTFVKAHAVDMVVMPTETVEVLFGPFPHLVVSRIIGASHCGALGWGLSHRRITDYTEARAARGRKWVLRNAEMTKNAWAAIGRHNSVISICWLMTQEQR
jgi:hypothetical protein